MSSCIPQINRLEGKNMNDTVEDMELQGTYRTSKGHWNEEIINKYCTVEEYLRGQGRDVQCDW